MNKLSIALLWVLVMSGGILMGGSLYETVVVNPLWAGDLPGSVTRWTHGAIQTPFFQVATPSWALLSALTLGLSFKMPQSVRPWARVAGTLGVVIMVWTLVYFVPRVEATEGRAGAGMSPDEITRAASEFIHWGYLRTAMLAGAWMCSLRALFGMAHESALAALQNAAEPLPDKLDRGALTRLASAPRR